MLLGQNCGKKNFRMEEDIDQYSKAVSILMSLSFVGMTDRWEESICKFQDFFNRMSFTDLIHPMLTRTISKVTP